MPRDLYASCEIIALRFILNAKLCAYFNTLNTFRFDFQIYIQWANNFTVCLLVSLSARIISQLPELCYVLDVTVALVMVLFPILLLLLLLLLERLTRAILQLITIHCNMTFCRSKQHGFEIHALIHISTDFLIGLIFLFEPTPGLPTNHFCLFVCLFVCLPDKYLIKSLISCIMNTISQFVSLPAFSRRSQPRCGRV